MLNNLKQNWFGYFALFVCTASMGTGPATTQSVVLVTMKPSTIQQRTFDPDNPPAGLPLDPNIESACAAAMFSCHCETDFSISQEKPGESGIVMVSQVKAIRITLCLDETLWLPEQASAKLLAHEKGHAKISERYFTHAKNAVEEAAAKLIGQSIQVEAKDHQAALDAAGQQVNDQIAKLYKLKTTTASLPVQQAYDQLTDHSRNKIPEEKAIPMALKHSIEPLTSEIDR